MDLACWKMACLKLRVKLGCSPQHTQMVPKMALGWQTGLNKFLQHARAVRCGKMFLFSPGANFGGTACLGTGKKVRLKLWVKLGCFPRHTQMLP